ncbi:MAG: cation diffusion facilitator family transporter [Duncaniella sp.]|nr:cation diffusion facilitator family transporter [Duncaniella sp.]HBI58450.1 cation-efflux pump [Porphyromonadaceae bacterium]
MTDSREKEIYKVTLIGSAVNALLIVAKFVAGIAGRSSAMIADAIHSLSDFATDIVVLVFVRLAGRPKDSNHTYGHGKFETLATLIIGVALAAVGTGVLVNGINLVIDSVNGRELPRPTMLALAVAVLSILLKEGIYRYTVSKGKQLESQSVVANAWHHRSDAVSSIGTLVGISGAMFLGDKWRILDPLAAIVVSFFIIKVGWDISRPCIDELLEKSLPKETIGEIARIITSVDGICELHNLRTRRIGNNIAIEAHVRMDGNMSLREAHALASEAEDRLKTRFGPATHVGLHMEPRKRHNKS